MTWKRNKKDTRMTCVKCKVRQIDALITNGNYYSELRLAFCSYCREGGFPDHLLPQDQYVKYWLVRSKPHIEERKRK